MNAPSRIFTAPIEEESEPLARAIALYDTACSALAEVKTIGAAKDIRDKADAIRVFARQAENRQLEIDAAEIRIRAERKLGELIDAQKDATGLNRGRAGAGRPALGGAQEEPPKDDRPTLAELGVDKKLSSRAQRLAHLPPEAFEDRINSWRETCERDAGRVSVRIVHDVDKKTARAVREEVLGRKIAALPDAKFGVILADPEWRFDPRSRESGMDRAPENHYPTSALVDLQRRDVAAIAADDCVLFLWATVPMLPEAFCVLDAWGFSAFVRDAATGLLGLDKSRGRYVSSAAWKKYAPGDRIGLGYWFRVDHEILLVATRGAPVCPAPGEQYRSVIDEPASRIHSQKPEIVLSMVDDFYPNTPKIELNRRGAPRPGWSAWGNEATQTTSEAEEP